MAALGGRLHFTIDGSPTGEHEHSAAPGRSADAHSLTEVEKVQENPAEYSPRWPTPTPNGRHT